jgi:ankyrin repeat protein
MSDRHFELPANPNLEFYRKQAKQLHAEYTAGDPDASVRVVDVLGGRAAERFLLSDAQFVLARERGFRSWAAFRAHIEQRRAGDRPVSRFVATIPANVYAAWADALLTELRRDDPAALRRWRAYAPGHATDAGATELEDARLVIAREVGFSTWQELLAITEKHRREHVERMESWRRLRPEMEALLAGDTGRLASVTAEQANDLLHALAGPETILGTRMGPDLGVPPAGVDVLISKATNLEVPLVQAAYANRVDYVRRLLAAGADLGTRTWGITPLECAINFGRTETVNLLAERAIVPASLWTYAACGRLDLVRACFDANGRLRPDAATARPDPVDIGMPARLPTDEPEQIVGEAFVHACQHGRTEVVRWFLDHGVHPDTAPYLGRTGLHWAIPAGSLEVVRLLMERGADPSIRDDVLEADADGWLHIFLFPHRPHDPITQQIHDLIDSYRA